MLRLSGRVIVRETRIGVPDLLVTAYDLTGRDGAIASEAAATHIAESGRRIASVVTDADGRFEISLEDLHFTGNQERPDLRLVIFAPEDVAAGAQTPPAAEKRILYAQLAPRRDAGAEEAYIIRLAEEQLARLDLLPAAPRDGHPQAGDRLAAASEQGYARRDAVRAALSERLKSEQKRVDGYKALAQRKTASLSAIPLHLRDGTMQDTSRLIASRQDLAEKLAPMMLQTATDAFERWKSSKPSMRLDLTEAEAKALGVDLENRKSSTGIDPKLLADKVRSMLGGVDLIFKSRMTNPSPDELQRKYLSSPVGKLVEQAKG